MMDHEWTYRPPLLIGEKILWVAPSYPHNTYSGSVAWIGRIPEISTSWTVGVNFVDEVPGGADGTWGAHHLFICNPGRGLFLPIESLIKDDSSGAVFCTQGYNFSSTTTASEVTSASCSAGIIIPVGLSSSDITKELQDCSEVISVNGNTPSSTTAASSFNTTCQNTLLNINSAFPSLTSKDKKKYIMSLKQVKGEGRPSSRAGHDMKKESYLCPKPGNIRVSSSCSSIGVSSRMFEGGIDLDNGPCLEAQHRGNSFDESDSYFLEESRKSSKKSKGGFLNLFRWFRFNNKRKHSLSSHRNSVDSINSTSSVSSSFAYFPISRSASAQNCRSPSSDLRQDSLQEHAAKSNKLLRHRRATSEGNSSNKKAISDINNLDQSRSSLHGSSFSVTSHKKRPAPKPPSDSDSIVSESNFQGFHPQECSLSRSDGQELQKSRSESIIYERLKRRAPQPPFGSWSKESVDEKTTDDVVSLHRSTKKRPAPPVPVRTAPNLCKTYSLSNSERSDCGSTSTVQATPPSSPNSTDNRSKRSEQVPSSLSFPLVNDGKVSQLPKPWYKRKKRKQAKSKEEKELRKEKIYESWMPDIQFSRGNTSSGDSTAGDTFTRFFSRRSDSHEKMSKYGQKEENKSQPTGFMTTSLPVQQETLQSKKVSRVEESTNAAQWAGSQDPEINSLGMEQIQNRLCSDMRTDLAEQDHNPDSFFAYDNLNSNFHHNCCTGSQNLSSCSETQEVSCNGYSHGRVTLSPNHAEYMAEALSQSKELSLVYDGVVRTPIQNAAFDAELFYQLAKDSQQSTSLRPNFKRPPSREGRMSPITQEESLPGKTITEERGVLRRPAKNFGIRMNNIFSPDVSTIIEASESVTSSATTPGDAEENLTVMLSGGHREINIDSASIITETNYEFHLNSYDAKDIMQELADVSKEIQRINEQEEEERVQREEKKKADKIREEVLMLRERDNFLAWREAMDQASSTESSVAKQSERKQRWICDACTLINVPWRMNCEACSTHRSATSKRVDDKSRDLHDQQSKPEGEKTLNRAGASTDQVDASGVGNRTEYLETPLTTKAQFTSQIASERCSRARNWEKELQKYFTNFDEYADSMSKAISLSKQSSPVSSFENRTKDTCGDSAKSNGGPEMSATLPVNVNNRSRHGIFGTKQHCSEFFLGDSEREKQHKNQETFSQACQQASNASLQPDLEGVRKARLAKFQQNQMSHDGDSDARKWGRATETFKVNQIKQVYEPPESVNPEAVDSDQLNKSPPNSPESSRRKMKSDAMAIFHNQEKNFYKKDYRKKCVLMSSGLVRQAVSVFNQKDQLNRVGRPSDKKKKQRMSFGSVIEHTQKFDHFFTENEIQDTQRPSNSGQDAHRHASGSLVCEININAAITKFDELAALAEVERLKATQLLQKPKHETAKNAKALPSTRNLCHSERPMDQLDCRGSRDNLSSICDDKSVTGTTVSLDDETALQDKVSCYSNKSLPDSEFQSTSIPDSSVASLQEDEDYISCTDFYSCFGEDFGEGSLEDGHCSDGRNERRKCSLSLGSGTFELIKAKDFETIEAEHSYRPPSNSDLENTLVPQTLTTHHILPEKTERNLHITGSNTGQQDLSVVLTKKNEVEILSNQLREAGGIASFKELLKEEGPLLGQMNTLNIEKLLHLLESAISQGRHKEAAQLAHDLASLRISCSVSKSHISKSQSGSPDGSLERNVINSLDRRGVPDVRVRNVTSSCDAQSPSFREPEEKNGNIQAVNEGVRSDRSGDECLGANSEVRSDTANSLTPASCSAPFSETVLRTDGDRSHRLEHTNNMGSILSSDTQKPAGPDPASEKFTAGNLNQNTEISSDHPPARREHKVDQSRRQVKSDIVNKLPDDSSNSTSVAASDGHVFSVQMYVEDKNSHTGPVSISVSAGMTVGELKKKVYQEFGFPLEVQRWILGRILADDDANTLEHYKVTASGCPVFLYLVAPEKMPRKKVLEPSTDFNQAGPSSASGPLQATAKSSGQSASGLSDGYKKYRDMCRDTKDAVESAKKSHQLHQRSSSSEAETSGSEKALHPTSQAHLLHKSSRKEVYGVLSPEKTEVTESELGVPHEEKSFQDSFQMQCAQSAGSFHIQPTSVDSNRNPFPITVKNFIDSSATMPPSAVPLENNSMASSAPSTHGTTTEMNSTGSSGAKNSVSQETREAVPQGHKISDQYNLNTAEREHSKANNNTLEAHAINPSSNHLFHSQSQQHITNQQQRTVKDSEPHLDLQENLLNNCVEEQADHQLPTKLLRNCSINIYEPMCQSNSTHPPVLQKEEEDAHMFHKDSKQNLAVFKNEHLPEKFHGTHESGDMATTKSKATAPENNSPAAERIETAVENNADAAESSTAAIKSSSSASENSTITKESKVLKKQGKKKGQAKKKDKIKAQHTEKASEATWVCPRCTLVNPRARPGCEACTTERPYIQEKDEPTKGAVKPAAAKKEASWQAVVSALNSEGVVSNTEPFECMVCFMEIKSGRGVVLRDCLHAFCRECLAYSVRYSETAAVKCPYRDEQYSCSAVLQEREVKALVSPKDYEKHLNKSVKEAAGSMPNVFHCLTPDCRGFCQYEDNVNVFHCDCCSKVNCLTCQAQHEGKTCKQYQDDVLHLQDEAARKTKKFFDDIIRRGDGMPCPKCSIMLVRKWGCDWMRCPMCRTEICWVTRGPRWGPGGQGDTSGGCKCGINGRKCHPKCTYCH